VEAETSDGKNHTDKDRDLEEGDIERLERRNLFFFFFFDQNKSFGGGDDVERKRR
jgi:hypothetical protein